jgi:hypothetical protein
MPRFMRSGADCLGGHGWSRDTSVDQNCSALHPGFHRNFHRNFCGREFSKTWTPWHHSFFFKSPYWPLLKRAAERIEIHFAPPHETKAIIGNPSNQGFEDCPCVLLTIFWTDWPWTAWVFFTASQTRMFPNRPYASELSYNPSSVLSIIGHSYWSYVLQLSYRLGATLCFKFFGNMTVAVWQCELPFSPTHEVTLQQKCWCILGCLLIYKTSYIVSFGSEAIIYPDSEHISIHLFTWVEGRFTSRGKLNENWPCQSTDASCWIYDKGCTRTGQSRKPI